MKHCFWYGLICVCLSGGLAEAKDCSNISLSGALNQDTLWQDFTVLADASMEGRKTGSEGAKKARQFLQARYKSLGLQPFPQYADYLQHFHYPNDNSSKTGSNVVAWRKGTQSSDFVVLTAHYDHLGKRGNKIFYGADDNASGVAAMLALAEALDGYEHRYNMIFVATDAEENGLYGAKAFVRHSPVDIQHIVLNINLDMLAEGGRRKRLYITSQNKSADPQFEIKIQRVIESAGLCLVKGHRNIGFNHTAQKSVNWSKASDHAAFAGANIPYIFIGTDIHPRYHTPDDKITAIDRLFYTAATETAWLMLLEFAQ